MQVDFDPAKISYAAVLELFFASHLPTRPPWSSQYRSAIFAEGEEQLVEARRVHAAFEKRLGQRIYTEIAPLRKFWWAEDYHQKYMLRQSPRIGRELAAFYPRLEDFVDAPTAARINGYLGGNGSLPQLVAELPRFGLSPAAGDELLALARRRGLAPATCPLSRSYRDL